MIPKEAKYRGGLTFFEPNLKEWFCPDCGAQGTGEDVDFLHSGKYDEFDENDQVEYCCAVCFEQNIYITLNQE